MRQRKSDSSAPVPVIRDKVWQVEFRHDVPVKFKDRAVYRFVAHGSIVRRLTVPSDRN